MTSSYVELCYNFNGADTRKKYRKQVAICHFYHMLRCKSPYLPVLDNLSTILCDVLGRLNNQRR